ncbi:MAG: aspartyl/asparaginyl beta-hydroxylase domain-containing protein [Sphingomonadaceae bacterium]|nr:aspartyl/asparaginyl beta-hydroxylase domain-containing protein [Sphingomonadaceae bacterium]
MKIDRPLLKLPRQYCARTLAAEVAALPPSAWLAHPGRIMGNDAVPLITPDGTITNAFAGPMAPTDHLRACPYILEIMADLEAVWGRSRLMGLAPGAIVPEHVDVGHYWRTHLRIHIPVVTNPGVAFTCEGETVNMAAGECWIFDSFRIHDVRNSGTEKRIHLVLDTVGGEKLWDLMREGERAGRDPAAAKFIAPGSVATGNLRYEQINTPDIMSVWEVRCHVDFLLEQAEPGDLLDITRQQLERFLHEWGALWAQFGADSVAQPSYQALIEQIRRELQRIQTGRLVLPNGVPLDRALNELVFMAAAPAPAPTPAISAAR